MSAAVRLTAPARGRPLREAAEAPARLLRLVPALDRSRTAMRWLAAAAGVVGAAMLAQLLLAIAISQGAYEAGELEGRQLELERQSTSLEEQLSTVESPQNLTSQATALGLKPSTQMSAIDPATGQIVVVGGPARTTPNPALVGNEALNPSQPNAANPNVVPAVPVANGVSAGGGAPAPVPSATEIAAPTTR